MTTATKTTTAHTIANAIYADGARFGSIMTDVEAQSYSKSTKEGYIRYEFNDESAIVVADMSGAWDVEGSERWSWESCE